MDEESSHQMPARVSAGPADVVTIVLAVATLSHNPQMQAATRTTC